MEEPKKRYWEITGVDSDGKSLRVVIAAITKEEAVVIGLRKKMDEGGFASFGEVIEVEETAAYIKCPHCEGQVPHPELITK